MAETEKMKKDQFVQQLKQILKDFDEWSCRHGEEQAQLPLTIELITRGTAAVERITGIHSAYSRELRGAEGRRINQPFRARAVHSVVLAVLRDLEGGYLATLADLIHAETFADFLEMADYFCQQKYKDAAAVIAGSTLEGHLRALCVKHEIPIQTLKPDGSMSHLKADAMNAELAKKEAYSKLDQKNVTAWLGIRNSAAHGKYDEYDERQVNLLIASIRDFVTRTTIA